MFLRRLLNNTFALFAGLFVLFAADTVLAQSATTAPAVGPAGPTNMSPFQFILGTVNFFLIAFLVYFILVLRPLQQKQEKQSKFIGGLKSGDKVITSGGIFAKVVSVNPSTAVLEIASGTKITISSDHVREIPSEPARSAGSSAGPASGGSPVSKVR